MSEKDKKLEVEILPEDYEPTQAEMNEVFRIDATPEELAKAMLRPVNVRRKDLEKHRKERKS